MGYKRSVEDRRRMKKLYDETKTKLIGGAFFDKSKGRIIRFSYSDNPRGRESMTKYLKRQSNKRVRKSDELYERGTYRRVYDYRWMLF